ncbi:MAG: hypothetical protein ACR2N3_19060 [Pyrinomonadaceae bacterium]
MKKALNILVAGLILFTLSAAGQTTTITGTSQTKRANAFTYAYTTAEKVVKNAPYSAEATTELVRVLGDGNKITRLTKTLLYRDSEGRTRREETSKPVGAFPLGITETVTIFDPVAGYRYYLNPTAKTTRRVAIPLQKPIVAAQNNSSTYNFPAMAATSAGNGNIFTVTYPTAGYSTKNEDLGSRAINGVEAIGKSSMTTIATGTIGNERDIVTTSETWYSKDLQMTILNKRNDPQTGNYTYQLTNVKRSEPDKSLFTVPADYKIVDSPAGGTTIFGTTLRTN